MSRTELRWYKIRSATWETPYTSACRGRIWRPSGALTSRAENASRETHEAQRRQAEQLLESVTVTDAELTAA